MADIELVIKIPEEIYLSAKTEMLCGAEVIVNAIKNGAPQPKTGHWIYSKAVNTGEIIFSECSVCGNGESRCAKRMKYCPNCGTKMVEPQESEGRE